MRHGALAEQRMAAVFDGQHRLVAQLGRHAIGAARELGLCGEQIELREHLDVRFCRSCMTAHFA
ncbi:MAG TPA: hypothetical protein VEW74_01145 [Candidatus Nitrosotalea sp.]|nr:hypothetical protein [Candidatus Nitrosotalea sp.]